MDQRKDTIDIWDCGNDATTVVISNTMKRFDRQNRGQVRNAFLNVFEMLFEKILFV